MPRSPSSRTGRATVWAATSTPGCHARSAPASRGACIGRGRFSLTSGSVPTPVRGTQLELTVARAVRGLLGSDLSATSFTAALRSFVGLTREVNFCGQLVARATTGRSDALLFRARGLREIRGFPDAYFLAQQLVHANLEVRADVMRTNAPVPAIGQVAGFADLGWVGSRADAVAGLPYSGPVASIGAGLRWIPIPFARAVGRLDVAVGLYPQRK